MSSLSSSSNKNHSKKSNNSRDRDKNKINETGEITTLTDKDVPQSQGRFAGIGAESVQCMAEQIGVELNTEAATNLAEDVSYKLRQTISAIALHSEMMKKSCMDSWDVNTVFRLADTSPVVGACSPQYAHITEEKICCEVETLHDITEYAMTTQSYVYSTLPTISVEWITDEKSVNQTGNISDGLQNYYTKVAKAILNLKKKPKQIAVKDLTTNTRIGPIFPNLFNLAVLVLNDDNLNALNVPAKKPLQSNVLDMVDALCSNPCSLDTNIQQQFQRLFPVMVSNILGNGSLAEKMVAILTKITRTWPPFIAIGKGILFDYLSQGTKERLTAPMIRCVMALGRRALTECLGEHLDHIDDCLHAPKRTHGLPDLREAILDVSSCLLKSEPTTYLEDYVMTDYTLYEMLGDSIIPRRTIFLFKDTRRTRKKGKKKKTQEEFTIIPIRPVARRPKIKILQTARTVKKVTPRETVFEPVRRSSGIRIAIKNCRSIEPRKVERTHPHTYSAFTSRLNSEVVAASGFLDRFRYKLNRNKNQFPIFGALTL
ncbi:uncharacterized protein [Epargyreus clarus]|uniref:uncharacterized protein n=1 Tax=Epargyreus clarus TaxID=520877 RepID=UPI003C2C37AF